MLHFWHWGDRCWFMQFLSLGQMCRRCRILNGNTLARLHTEISQYGSTCPTYLLHSKQPIDLTYCIFVYALLSTSSILFVLLESLCCYFFTLTETILPVCLVLFSLFPEVFSLQAQSIRDAKWTQETSCCYHPQQAGVMLHLFALVSPLFFLSKGLPHAYTVKIVFAFFLFLFSNLQS